MATERAADGAWFERARRIFPGGVNSPARSFQAVGLDTPVVIERGRGAWVWDTQGRRYLDYQAAFGPLVLGHAHPRVVEAICRQAAQGSLTGATHPREVEWAEALTAAIPGLEQLRFVTSGTEAVMSAIRLARGYTGRTRVVKFSGAYHGHSDAVLVKAGSGASTVGIADSAGIPHGVLDDVVVLPYNRLEPVETVCREMGESVAAILVEPVEGNMGLVHPAPGFLEGLRALATRIGAVLIFDEVITAFRFHYGPVASLLGVTPDLYCLGKIIGGGLPAGAYGGRRELMEAVAPAGPVFQAGTLAGNPLSAAAGLAMLAVLRETNPYPEMDRLGARLEAGLLAQAREAGLPATINRLGGMFTLFFGPDPVTDYASALATDAGRFARFFRAALRRGIYLAPSRLECWFVSAAHTEADIDWTLERTRDAFAEVAADRDA
jgi:glutamate-1-semialdehyde 2,1-aminomutase